MAAHFGQTNSFIGRCIVFESEILTGATEADCDTKALRKCLVVSRRFNTNCKHYGRRLGIPSFANTYWRFHRNRKLVFFFFWLPKLRLTIVLQKKRKWNLSLFVQSIAGKWMAAWCIDFFLHVLERLSWVGWRRHVPCCEPIFFV